MLRHRCGEGFSLSLNLIKETDDDGFLCFEATGKAKAVRPIESITYCANVDFFEYMETQIIITPKFRRRMILGYR